MEELKRQLDDLFALNVKLDEKKTDQDKAAFIINERLVLFNGFSSYHDLIQFLNNKKEEITSYIESTIIYSNETFEAKLFILDAKNYLENIKTYFQNASDTLFNTPVRGKIVDRDDRIKNYNINWDKDFDIQALGYPEENPIKIREVILTISKFQHEVWYYIYNQTCLLEEKIKVIPNGINIFEALGQRYVKPQTIKVEPQGTGQPIFTPIQDDNRTAKKGVASFHDLIRNPQRFASFEEKLFQNDYITYKYAYCGKHGYKNQLAIIYHLLIDKNYFMSFNDTTKKKIIARDIVKFLNHRYDIDLDKQFRSYADKPEERADIIEKNSWLSNLPMCEMR